MAIRRKRLPKPYPPAGTVEKDLDAIARAAPSALHQAVKMISEGNNFETEPVPSSEQMLKTLMRMSEPTQET